MSPEKRKLAAQEVRAAEPAPEEELTEPPYTLEEFSYQFFRCASHSKGQGGQKAGVAGARLWAQEGKAVATLRGQAWAEKALAQALTLALYLAGPQRRRPLAGPQCPWPEAGAICGPTPQSHCASHCSNVSMTKSNCGMRPARSSSISFQPPYPSCRRTHLGPLHAPQHQASRVKAHCRANIQLPVRMPEAQ